MDLRDKHFVSTIFAINKKKLFTLDEANELLPLVIKLTEDSSRQVKKLINQLEAFPDKKNQKAVELEEQVNKLIELWQTKIEKLGLRPKGLWLCDFDNGAGYFCWKYPESQISHFHGYNEGFSGRKKLGIESQPTI
ncbi:MAG: DUF2203 domain-containing protein [Bdellovibrionaceae bacterium]|nr:DUF2203 domain-containing protein [Pseudobdellovibrionaceae bacterium]